jgi:hypothetical protein
MKERKKIWLKNREVPQMWLHARLSRLINTGHNALMQPSCDYDFISDATQNNQWTQSKQQEVLSERVLRKFHSTQYWTVRHSLSSSWISEASGINFMPLLRPSAPCREHNLKKPTHVHLCQSFFPLYIKITQQGATIIIQSHWEKNPVSKFSTSSVVHSVACFIVTKSSSMNSNALNECDVTEGKGKGIWQWHIVVISTDWLQFAYIQSRRKDKGNPRTTVPNIKFDLSNNKQQITFLTSTDQRNTVVGGGQ